MAALRLPSDHTMLATAPDPHHDSWEGELGWDGRRFYKRYFVGRGQWVELRRMHPTPARVKVMSSMLSSIERTKE